MSGNVLCDSIRSMIRPGRPVAYVDLPTYLNIGDSLIALGGLRAIRGIRSKFRTRVYGNQPDWGYLSALNRACGTILINGGGNFGSLWPRHQRLKEAILQRCPKARVIQLPQSIHFESASDAERAFGVCRRHHDFILCVRDHSSHELASQHGVPDVRLSRDTATWIDLGRPKPSSLEVMLMLRRDSERSRHFDVDDRLSHFGPVARGDWARYSDLPPHVARWRLSLESALFRSARVWTARGEFMGGIGRALVLFRNRLEIGRECVSFGRVVVTDRLHVHILCREIGHPHVFLDNSYGKLRRYSKAWRTESEISVHAATAEDVETAVGALLNRSGSSGRIMKAA